MWDKFHSTSMELSEDGSTIKKINDFPDFSNAMGSVWFSSGQHEWELKMGSVSRMWVGVASAEHFELGEHPTCFRDVWLISSFGGRHPDTGFGGSLSLEMMFTTGGFLVGAREVNPSFRKCKVPIVFPSVTLVMDGLPNVTSTRLLGRRVAHFNQFDLQILVCETDRP